jgi:phosphatidylserine decarboxylase
MRTNAIDEDLGPEWLMGRLKASPHYQLAVDGGTVTISGGDRAPTEVTLVYSIDARASVWGPVTSSEVMCVDGVYATLTAGDESGHMSAHDAVAVHRLAFVVARPHGGQGERERPS